jgi:hypothetical protein
MNKSDAEQFIALMLDLPRGKGRPVGKAENLTAFCEPIA